MGSGDASGSETSPAADQMEARIREYWEWIAVALFLFTTVDMITTVFAARSVGIDAEVNPLIEWTLTHGPLAYASVNIAVVILVVTLFWGLMVMLERTPSPVDRVFAVAIELWLGLVLTVGLLIFANNIVVIIFGESLL